MEHQLPPDLERLLEEETAKKLNKNEIEWGPDLADPPEIKLLSRTALRKTGNPVTEGIVMKISRDGTCAWVTYVDDAGDGKNHVMIYKAFSMELLEKLNGPIKAVHDISVGSQKGVVERIVAIGSSVKNWLKRMRG